MKEQAVNESSVTFRHLPQTWGAVQSLMLALATILGLANIVRLPSIFEIPYFEQQYLALFVGIMLAVTFISVPAHARSDKQKIVWYDKILSLLSISLALYLVILYPQFTYSLSIVTADKLFFALLSVLLILEAVRRLFGWVMMLVPLLFMVYMFTADMMPALFSGRAMPIDRGVVYVFLDPNGMLGIVLRMIATIVLVFIVFGHVLIKIGAGNVLTNFALAVLGGLRGGPAKAAIVMSSLFGSISGSPVANVTVTGTFTIPLMKKTGYPLTMAAAIESVASTGGLIMPPVMGTTAFILAEFLGRPYSDIIIAAIMPALLFYMALFIQADLDARRLRLSGLHKDELPDFKETVLKFWVFAIPIVILIYFLFGWDISPARAGLYTIIAIIIQSWFIKGHRIGLRTLYDVMVQSGRSLLHIGVIGAAVGFVVGSVSITGLSVNISRILLELGGGSVILLLAITAVTCIILGMGMPSTPVYVTLAILIAPALINAGITPIAAHMFIFYYGILSFITPPVAISSYAAAAVAGTNAMAVGWRGMRLSVLLYIMPWIFVLVPELLILDMHRSEYVPAILVATLATLTTSLGFGGWMLKPLSVLDQAVMFAVAMMLWASMILLSSHGPLYSMFEPLLPWLFWVVFVTGMVLWLLLISKVMMFHNRSK